MTNTLELEIVIKKSGFTKREVAKRLGISEMGFYKKLNNPELFTERLMMSDCENYDAST